MVKHVEFTQVPTKHLNITMKTDELFEGVNDSLTGYVNIEALASMLPDINNVAAFQNAINKIRLGNGTQLIMAEKIQLALAFISLIGLTAPQKTTVIRQMMSIQVATTSAQAQQNQTAATQTNQQSATNPAPAA